MAGGGYLGKGPYQGTRGEIDLTVSIRYHGLKATQYFAKFTQKSLTTLNKDILALKFPHPKSGNIVFLSHGCVEFTWFGAKLNGPLHQNLIAKLRPNGYEGKNALQSTLSELSIASVDLKEIPVPPITHLPSSKKRSFAYSIYDQLHKKGSLDPKEVQSMQEPDFSNSSSNPFLTGDKLTSSTSTEADQFLQEMETTLRPMKRAKLEYIEPTMPPTHQPPQASAPPPPQTMAPPASKPLVTTPLSTSSTPDAFPVPPSPMSPQVQVATSSPPHQVTPPWPLFTLPQSSSHSSSVASSGNPPSPKPHTTLNALTGIPPKPADVPAIQSLTRELWDIRRQIEAGLSREHTIIENLKQLNATFVPPPSQFGNTAATEAVTIMKTRLQVVERELGTERKLRQEAEAALNDVKRECKEPFIVPALLDAFMTISKLTSATLAPRKS